MPRKSAKYPRTEHSTQKATNGPYRLNALEQQVSDDIDWAQTAAEVQKHQGEFVVVHQKRVVATGRDRDAVLAQASVQENCPKDELAVVVVPPSGPWETPH